MASNPAVEQLQRSVTPELYDKVRQLWQTHSIAEDNRDLAGLLSTLTENCVYELGNASKVWRGHAGAASFYTELLTAFPDIHFSLRNIVIGPQGVSEEAHVTGTHRGDWLDYPASGRAIEFDVIIFFPWDLELEKFTGERVFFFNLSAPPGETG